MELAVPARLLHLSTSSSAQLLIKPRINLPHKLLPVSTKFRLSTLSSRRLMDSHTTPRASINSGDGDNNNNNNDSIPTSSAVDSDRIGEVKRVTKETNVFVKINLDGSGVADSSTCIPFLDHMLDQLASHGLFDVHVRATGDIHIDDHHTNEDVALAIGTALSQALGDRKGINRFGDFLVPLDEALIHVSLDLSGRPHLNYDLQIPTQRVGTYDTQFVEHFFQSLVNTSGMTLHIRQLAGKNSHHIIEATFKAFARALRQATEYDPRRRGTIPRSHVALPLEEAALSRRHVIACSSSASLVAILTFNCGLTSLPAHADDNIPLPARVDGKSNSQNEKEEGVVGAIKSLFDPNEKTKTRKVLPKAYLKSARELVKTLRESLKEDPKDVTNFRRNADAAKESIRDYLSNWRGDKAVASEESYVELEKAIRSLASFYSKAGPSAPLPEEVKSEILNDLDTAEEFL